MKKETPFLIGFFPIKTVLVFFVLILALGSGWIALLPDLMESSGKRMTVDLKRGNLSIFEYPSKKDKTSAIILFASGDGGWSSLEEAVACTLRKQGYEVVGIDSANYAASDYDLETLQSDFAMIAQMAEAPFGSHPRPLIVGGYSMGAAQAIAVAGGPHPPSELIGLLLMDPLNRGRYGLRDSDQLDVLPTGPGTFGVSDFAPNIKNLRVVQWHAMNDSIDSRSWLASLTVSYKELDLPDAGHDYDIGRDAFLRQLAASIDWILGPAQKGMITEKNKG